MLYQSDTLQNNVYFTNENDLLYYTIQKCITYIVSYIVCEACTCTFYMCGVWVGVSDWVCV